MNTTVKIDKSPAAVAVRNAIDTDACAHCFVNEPIFAVKDKFAPSGFVVVCPACAAKSRGR